MQQNRLKRYLLLKRQWIKDWYGTYRYIAIGDMNVDVVEAHANKLEIVFIYPLLHVPTYQQVQVFG